MEHGRKLLNTAIGIPARPPFRAPVVSDAVKRLFDVIAASFGLILLAPVFLLLGLLIKRESPGPVFYRGARMGRNGRVFQILKFRTMREEAASYAGPVVTAQDDPRITPLGRWLRDTKLNELPQLWNVLAGEMSMVGPRPEAVEIARSWPEAVSREILSVRPGITSPASIVYRDEEHMLQSASVMDEYLKTILPDKLRLDQLYIRHRSVLSDLDIILWTLMILLPRLGKRPVRTESFYNGLLNRFTRRYVIWFIADTLVAFMAVGAVGVLWRLSAPLKLGLQPAIAVALMIAIVFSLVNFMLGLGQVWWRYARPQMAVDLALSSTISTLLVAALNWFWPGGPLLPRGMILEIGLMAFFGFGCVRYRRRLFGGVARRLLARGGRRSVIGERVLVVGAGECGLLATWLLRRSKLSTAFTVIGMVDDDPAKNGMSIEGHHVFGFTSRIPELVRRRDVGVILYAIETIEEHERERILELCRQTRARLVLIPDLLANLREQFSRSLTEAAV